MKRWVVSIAAVVAAVTVALLGARPSAQGQPATTTPVRTVKFGRRIAGRRYAFAAEARRPSRIVYCTRPTPRLSGPFISVVTGQPASRAASNQASIMGSRF